MPGACGSEVVLNLVQQGLDEVTSSQDSGGWAFSESFKSILSLKQFLLLHASEAASAGRD